MYKGEAASEAEYEEDESLGKFAEWVKRESREITVENLQPRTMYLWKNYNLKRGGYPFTANELTPEDWLDLGIMDRMFNRIDLHNMNTAIWGKAE